MTEPKYQILIVEDNDADIYLIRQAIELVQVHADIHVLMDGQQAVRFLDVADADQSAPCPDLVLLDLNLPRKSGEEVLQHLRATRSSKDALVLVVTSSDIPGERERTKSLGASGFFVKPSNYRDFMQLGPLVRVLLHNAGRRENTAVGPG